MSVRAVLFDMDGVLVDTFDAWVAVLDACRTARDLEPLGAAGVQAVWGQGIEADARILFDGVDPTELAREYDERFTSHLGKARTIDGAAALVRSAREHGLRTAVVTNSPVDLAHQILRAIDLVDDFEFINCGDEVERGKPDPALVRLALERLSLSASDAVMIGDTPLDVQAARAAGVRVIGFGVDGDHRVDSLEEVRALIPF